MEENTVLENKVDGLEANNVGVNPEVSDDNRGPDAHDSDDNRVRDGHGSEDLHGHDDRAGEQQTFDRSYVEKLRKENAKYRERAGKADDLAHRLHVALVAADGRLADPEDLPYSDEHLDDPDALAAAVAELIERKPGLRAQKLRGDVGAGDRGTRKSPPADLISLIRGL